MTATLSAPQSVTSWLGDEGEDLLTHKAKVSKDLLHLPGPDFLDRIFVQSDRSPQVLRSLRQLIHLNLACGSRDRTFGGRFVCTESDVF